MIKIIAMIIPAIAPVPRPPLLGAGSAVGTTSKDGKNVYKVI